MVLGTSIKSPFLIQDCLVHSDFLNFRYYGGLWPLISFYYDSFFLHLFLLLVFLFAIEGWKLPFVVRAFCFFDIDTSKGFGNRNSHKNSHSWSKIGFIIQNVGNLGYIMVSGCSLQFFSAFLFFFFNVIFMHCHVYFMTIYLRFLFNSSFSSSD